ncbi:MAG: adenylate/guanylate cyclase domain-containing protein [bacterium]
MAQEFVSIHGLDDQIIFVDRERRVEYANRPVREQLGYSGEEIEGLQLEQIDHFPFGDGVLGDLVEAARSSGQPEEYESSYHNPETDETEHVKITAHDRTSGTQIVITDQTQQYRVEKAFRKYVGPDMLEHMKDSDERYDIPRRTEVTVLFADLRSFTSLAQNLPASEVRELLNAFFNEAIPIVYEHQGTVDKLIGDELMAFFGAPVSLEDHTLRALRSGIEIIKAQKRLIDEWDRQSKRMLSCGIGIETGEAVVGNIGGQLQQDYTAVGNTVNRAARLCGSAESNQIITSNSVYQSAYDQSRSTESIWESEPPESFDFEQGRTVDSGEFAWTSEGELQVKGVDQPITTFSVSPGNQFEPFESTPVDSGSETETEDAVEEDVRTFGDYELLGQFARGKMGVVHSLFFCEKNVTGHQKVLSKRNLKIVAINIQQLEFS